MTSDELFHRALSRDGFKISSRKQSAPHDQEQDVATVLLLPLSERQIQEFARQRGVENADAFIEEIERHNAWCFARRPLDLIELIAIWLSKGKLGTRQDQHAYNAEVKLKDRHDRVDAGILSGELAEEGVERLALAMALTRRRSIKPPDLRLTVPSEETVLDAATVLHHWTKDSTSALLRRAVFDPATLGRVRFHHQSMQEFLAARRLFKLRQKGLPVRSMFHLIFAEKYGERVVIPSMAPIAAWLAIWNADVFRELVARSPESLIMHGDPGSLSLGQRRAIIGEFVRRYSNGGWRGFRLPADQLQRISNPELATFIEASWGSKPENYEVRHLLLNLIGMGPARPCAGIAFNAARDHKEEQHLRTEGIKALVSCGAIQQLRKIARQMLKQPARWCVELIATVLPDLFPLIFTEAELIALLERHESHKLGFNSDGLERSLGSIVADQSKDWNRALVRRRLTHLIKMGAESAASWHEIKSRYRDFCPALAALCLLELEHNEQHPGDDLLESCAVACRLRGREEATGESIKNLHSWFSERTEHRERMFYFEVHLMDSFTLSTDSWSRYNNAMYHSLCNSVKASDKQWIESALLNDQEPRMQEIAVHAWIDIWSMQGSKCSELRATRKKLSNRLHLTEILDSRTKRAKSSASIQAYDSKARQQHAKWEMEERERMAGWDKWRNDLMESPQKHFQKNRIMGTVANMFHCLYGQAASSGSYCVWNYRTLEMVFGQEVADMAKDAFKQQWRSVRPKLWTERTESERSGTPYSWLYGLCGLMAESESPGWCRLLGPEEAKLAARYATVEINRFAPFLKDLTEIRPVEVEKELGDALEAELERGGDYPHLSLLQNLTHADLELKKLLAPRLEAFVLRQKNFSVTGEANYWSHNLNQLLGILSETCNAASAKKVGQFCLEQLKTTGQSSLQILWLRGAFRFSPETAPETLVEWCKNKVRTKSGTVPLKAIAGLFGDYDGVGLPIADPDLRARALGKLVRIAYRFVRPKDDVVHVGVYTPDDRDHAERGRSFLLSALLDTPGATARQVITELSQEKDFQHFADRLRHLARERAAKDAEFEAWDVGRIAHLHEQFDLPPAGRDAMHQVILDRLDDLQHDLDHDEFSDRRTLQRITDETEIQCCLAQKFQAVARGAYTLEREPEVADAKKPDLRFRSTSCGTKAAIEIKIADNNWSLRDLENALQRQLVGQYLRHESCKSGCLLLTFAGRKKKWRTASGKFLNASSLVSHLNKLAFKIEARDKGAVRVQVVGLFLNASTARTRLERQRSMILSGVECSTVINPLSQRSSGD